MTFNRSTPQNSHLPPNPLAAAEVSRPLAGLLVLLAVLTVGIPAQVEAIRRSQTDTAAPARSPTLQGFPAGALTGQLHHESQGVTRLQLFSQQWARSVQQWENRLAETAVLNPHSLDRLRGWMISSGLKSIGNVDIGTSPDPPGVETLFFRPDLEHLTGPGFLEPDALAGQIAEHSAAAGESDRIPQPDSRAAILDFANQLKRRGIELIVMPTPCKAAVEVRLFSEQPSPNTSLVRNLSFPRWKSDLQAAGVRVFDVAECLQRVRQRSPGQALYLQTDTHWKPVAVHAAALELAERIQTIVTLPTSPCQWKRSPPTEISNTGDLAELLQLPVTAGWSQPESITIQTVQRIPPAQDSTNIPARVLLLGDSFTNIYASQDMGWGTNAGLADQLACELQAEVDTVAVNGGGASAARQKWLRDLARGHRSLEHCRIVIWQFAERELSEGHWPLLALPEAAMRPQPETTGTAPAEWLRLRGQVRDLTSVADIRRLPYPDAIVCVHLDHVTISGNSLPGGEALVYAFGVRNRKLVAESQFVTGQTVELQVQAWDQVRTRFERLYRLELDDPEFHLVELPIYWLESP